MHKVRDKEMFDKMLEVLNILQDIANEIECSEEYTFRFTYEPNTGYMSIDCMGQEIVTSEHFTEDDSVETILEWVHDVQNSRFEYSKCFVSKLESRVIV